MTPEEQAAATQSPERDPEPFSSFPCTCGDPMSPGLHKTYGPCEPYERP